MEIHHHSHHPKKWKEYISEFFMLFLAVFAGFMAESYLEYRAERHKEHDYLVSLVTDLKLDSADMSYKMNNMKELVDTSRSVSKLLTKNYFSKEEVYQIYKNTIFLETKDCFLQFANGTIDQLRNAGGFRLIQNKEINDKIKDYILDQGRLSVQTELFRIEWTNSKHQKLNLLHSYVLYSKGETFEDLKFVLDESTLEEFKKNTGSYFLSNERKDLLRYSNSIVSQMGYLKVYRIMTKLQKEKATALILLIQKEINH
jgi:predicted house-cleaning noncanonical NTP pyrophosphatase (MazG superfamily)